MPTKLKSLKLDELSLVDYPANHQARMTIHKRSDEVSDKQETAMDKKEFDEAIAKVAEKLTKTESEMKVLRLKADMSDDEKAHMEDLSEDQKGKFMGMSTDERKECMGVKKSDEHIIVKGEKVFKSKVGDATFNVLKAQQEEIQKGAEDIKKAREEAEMTKLEKRVSDEFPEVAGDMLLKAKVLKHMSTAPEDVRKAFDAIMKSAQEMSAPAFKSIGHGQGNVIVTNDIQKARSTFNGKVAEIQKRDKCSRTEAMRKAQQEHPAEFEAMQEASRDAA